MPIEDGYAYLMKPEPRQNLGPIRTIRDEVLGRNIKVRTVSIGMVRNASERVEVEAILEPFPHIRINKAKDLQGWYKNKLEANAVRPRPCYTEAILTEPYGGYCPVRCGHCYINSGVRGYRATGLITVPLYYGEQVAKQLSKMRRGAAGYFTSFHEPFNPLERLYHNTYEAAKAFDAVGLPIFFLSRLIYPQWAVDLLTRNKYSYAQKSMNTSVEADWKKMSPGAPSLEAHYRDIQRIHNAGVYVSIQVNPIIPGITTMDEILALFRNLRKAGADHVIVKFIEAAYSWVPTLLSNLQAKYGSRVDKFKRLFTQNIGGQKTVDEAYRIKAHTLLSKEATRLGLTYSLCYEYAYGRDDDGGIISKTGVNLGPRFMTSDQCHGHRVPMFTRNTPDEKFKEIKQCPSGGCLYCADDNYGEPRCGDAIVGEARALRLVDLKKPISRSKVDG